MASQVSDQLRAMLSCSLVVWSRTDPRLNRLLPHQALRQNSWQLSWPRNMRNIFVLYWWNLASHNRGRRHCTKITCLRSIWSTTVFLLNDLAILTSSILQFKTRPMLVRLWCVISLVFSRYQMASRRPWDGSFIRAMRVVWWDTLLLQFLWNHAGR